MSQLSGNGQHTLAEPINVFWLYTSTAIGSVLLLFYCPCTAFVGFLALCAYVGFDFYRGWDEQWELKTAARQYLSVFLLNTLGRYQSWRFHEDSKNIRKAQDETLLAFLDHNSDTVYSKIHGLGEIRSREDLVRTQPLTKYAQIQPYVERMKKGEAKVLSSDKPTYFGKTSGTTGQPSVFPFTFYTKMQQIAHIALACHNAEKLLPWNKLHRLRPYWKSTYTPKKILEETPSGITCGPVTANPMVAKIGEVFTTPTVAFEIENSGSGAYVNLLFALRFRRLGAIEGVFASIVYFAFKKMENEWQDLVQDVRNGTIRPDPNISSEIRSKLLLRTKPDPERADELEREFKLGFENIASRIWPELKIINCITTGALTIYAQYLRNHYTKDILLYPVILGGTEGITGLNFWPFLHPSRFALLPRMIFYEFIPIEMSGEQDPPTLFIDQVKLGQDYEMVVTTEVGVCRYRIGDVVRVVSFYNQCPVVQFRHRVGAMLNSKGEKVTEYSIFTCLTEAAQDLSPRLKRIVDYSSCESIVLDLIREDDGQTGSHHVIFVELETASDESDDSAESDNGDTNGRVDHFKVAAELQKLYDERLQKEHFRYGELREIDSLGPSVVYPMKEGAFSRLREFMIKTTSVSPMQLKIPRVVQKEALLKFLLEERLTKQNEQ